MTEVELFPSNERLDLTPAENQALVILAGASREARSIQRRTPHDPSESNQYIPRPVGKIAAEKAIDRSKTRGRWPQNPK